MRTRKVHFGKATLRVVSMLALCLELLVFFGCGGGRSGQPSSSNISQTVGAATIQINVGDAPSDWIVAFTMSMSSMTLTNANGSSMSVAAGPMQMEMRHLMGTMAPIALTNIPSGTYSMASLNISSASVTYMDAATKQPVQKSLPGTTKTISLSPPLSIGSTPMTMNFDLDLAHSVSTDSNGNMVFSPVMSVTTTSPGSGQGPQYGGMDHMIGSIAGVSGNSLTMSMMQGLSSTTVMTNSSTQFKNMNGMGGMSTGMMVDVDARMQSDGSLVATRIESVSSGMSGGMMAEGVVNSTSGNPPTQLSIIADNGTGNGMMSSNLGATLVVNLAPSTTYQLDANGVNLNNLPFTPAFNSTSLAKGQRVDPESSGGMMGGSTINASRIGLEQQGLSGTVTSYASGSPASFMLMLPADCAFTSITGVATITVFQQPDTQLRGLTSITNGASVQVRGLLLFDAGSYKMVATTIMPH